MSRVVLRLGVVLIACPLVFILLIAPGLLGLPIALLLGWWPSLKRLSEALHPSPGSLLLFAFGLGAMVAGTDSFLKWLAGNVRAVGQEKLRGQWRFKWTLCAFGMMLCALVALCSVVLTTHQLYWFSQSNDPMFSDSMRERLVVRQAARMLEVEADAARWNSFETREAFRQEDFKGTRPPVSEGVQPVWIENTNDTLRAIILVPRHPRNRAFARIAILEPGSNPVTRNWGDLTQVLASFRTGGTNSAPASGSRQ